MTTNRNIRRTTASRPSGATKAKGSTRDRGTSRGAGAGSHQRGDVSRFTSQDRKGRVNGLTDGAAEGRGSRLSGRPNGLNESPSDYDRDGRGPAPKPRRGRGA